MKPDKKYWVRKAYSLLDREDVAIALEQAYNQGVTDTDRLWWQEQDKAMLAGSLPSEIPDWTKK